MLKIFNENEKLEIEKRLNEQFGIKKIPGLIIKGGTERLFLFQGSLKPKEILELANEIPVERIGIYFAKQQEGEEQIRLSLDGAQILKSQITKNRFELNDSQLLQWMKGHELNISIENRGYIIMTYQGEFLGTGKASALKISNFIPKNRRLKDSAID